MRTRTVQRYYCDFCRKAMGVRPAMERHEAVCFSNPTRKCGLCYDDQLIVKPMSELLATLRAGGLAALETATDDCPACINATLIQNGAERYPGDDSNARTFNYTDALSEWMGNGRGKYNDDRRYAERCE